MNASKEKDRINLGDPVGTLCSVPKMSPTEISATLKSFERKLLSLLKTASEATGGCWKGLKRHHHHDAAL